ncbi:hypothetical protein Droror1_Dr00015632 [Drosera rotundifolia]
MILITQNVRDDYMINRHLKGEDINSLHYPELMNLEEGLENGLVSVRHKQMEIYKMHKKNHKMLEEEHQRLTYMDIMDGNMRSGSQMEQIEGHGYPYPQERSDYQHQLPFMFHMEPLQLNLQERM